MNKPDRKQVTKATRVSLILDIVVPEGMEERGEDEVFAALRELGDDELRDCIEHSEGDPAMVPDYIWEDWEEAQRVLNERDQLVLRLSLDGLVNMNWERLSDLVVKRYGAPVEDIYCEAISVEDGEVLVRADFAPVRDEQEKGDE